MKKFSIRRTSVNGERAYDERPAAVMDEIKAEIESSRTHVPDGVVERLWIEVV